MRAHVQSSHAQWVAVDEIIVVIIALCAVGVFASVFNTAVAQYPFQLHENQPQPVTKRRCKTASESSVSSAKRLIRGTTSIYYLLSNWKKSGMSTPELIRSRSPDLTELPRRRTELTRQHLSVDDGHSEHAELRLSSSLPLSITREELSLLKKAQKLEKSKKFLLSSQEPLSLARSNRQVKSRLGLFRRVESVDENIQRRGLLSVPLANDPKKATDDFEMGHSLEIEDDIFDPEEPGNSINKYSCLLLLCGHVTSCARLHYAQ